MNFNKATNPTINYYACNTSLCAPGICGSVSYSDKTGNLLFYSDGSRVFDRNYNIMPSLDVHAGGSLLLGSYNTTFSLSQSVLAIPYPGNAGKYILFHINSNLVNNSSSPRSPLYYSVLDMNLNNGLGDIVANQKNIPLLNNVDVSFKLTAVLHCNKNDIWVVGHLSNSDKYFSFLVTSSGVNFTPAYFNGSFIPVANSRGLLKENDIGCVKISAAGNRLAAAHKGLDLIELFDFNSSTGTGNNLRTIRTIPTPVDTIDTWFGLSRGVFGVDFSPSGNKLYVSTTYRLRNTISNGWGTFLFQYDATLPTGIQVQNSQYQVCKIDNGTTAGAIQIANNGRMYLNSSQDLYSVLNPENSGVNCNFFGPEIDIVSQFPNLNLPGYLQSYFQYPIVANGSCQSQTINFNLENATGVSSIQWNFGDPMSGAGNTSSSFNPTHFFSSEGVYTVKAAIQGINGCIADTIVRIVSAGKLKIFLGNDTTLCQGDSLRLKANIPGAVIHWNNGKTDSVITIKQPGTYWVSVQLGDCSATDTIIITGKTLPQFSLGSDTIICSNASVLLFPTPVYSSVHYLWSNNAVTPTTVINNAGYSWLEISDQYGCKWRDTLNVSYKTLPNLNLGADTSICENEKVILNAVVAGASNYLWSNGLTTTTTEASQTGWYWCDVSKEGCIYRDSLQLSIKPLPVVNLGTDTSLCEGAVLQLNALNTGASYTWQDNSTANIYTVSKQGQFSVQVNLNGCITKDTIEVDYELKPRFTLGPDQFICQGQSVYLKPLVDTTWQLHWQDGTTGLSFTVKQPGIYFLDATNNCGNTRDEVLFTQGVCSIYVPTAFSPNGDAWNNSFSIPGTNLFTHFHLQVFNRYGQLLFETSDKGKGWDGKYKGQDQPSGAYVWVLNYGTANIKMKELKGSVLLIR